MLRTILSVLMTLFLISSTHAAEHSKHRLIVTTDIGGSDPDDTQSLIHLLVCSDRFDIEGIISAPAWVEHPDNTGKIHQLIDIYGKVRPNLTIHSIGYPETSHLHNIVARGQAMPHMSGVGAGKDSPGSELIINAVDNPDDNRPVWLTAWGGMNTIAQAIWKVHTTRSSDNFRKFISKIRIYDILGQDDAGAWIARNFPDILYIRNSQVYGWAPDDAWTRINIQSQGPLGAAYPDRIWATEGDSPAFLYLYPNGLNSPEHPDFGGWGGRFSSDKTLNPRGMDFIEKSGKSEAVYDDYYMTCSTPEGNEAISRWKEHIANDFAARMLWTVTPDFGKANHHPKAVINGRRGDAPFHIKARPGQKISLDAAGSSDPDGDSLSYDWQIYDRPSTCSAPASITGAQTQRCSLTIPQSAKGSTIHVILKVTDSGTPALTSYRRTIITII